MSIDPFKAEMKDNVILGRGAVDMKGPIASILVTILAIKRSGLKLRGDVIFTGVIGEEERSEGTEFLVKSGLKADGAIVGEPSNYEYSIGHRGLEWIEIRVKGKAAHGGMPQLGINAIEKAASLIERIRKDLYPELKKRFNEYMGPSVMNFGVINGGNQPSTVADECCIKIDRRYIPGETVASVIKEYQDIIDSMRSEDPEFEAEIIRMPNNMLTMDHLYLMTNQNDPIVFSVKESIKEVIRREPEITRKRGWTDAALLSNYGNIPTVIFGPGKISASHTKDEGIEVSQLIDAVEIYSGIIEKFCGIY
jgi:acetylornithine deacetylase/succinyl-diaminopimelate desuccinylase